jgi:hypothetical protein
MQALMDITKQLETPFLVQDIDLLPKGAVERDGKTLCMALPYADVRVYEDRLNAIAPGEWSTPPPTALAIGQKIIVYVTVIICGIAHTDVGEASASGENAGTESWAQAFKRACSQFGLGRYLYDLEKMWVPYDKQRKQIALDAQGKQNIVRQMYARARIAPHQLQDGSLDTSPASTQDASHTAITDQQVSSIRKLCQRLGKSEPEDLERMSYLSGKTTIVALTAEYKEQQAKNTVSSQDEMQHALPAPDIAALKAKWAAAYTIADEQIEARWKKYLQYLLKLEETELKKYHVATITRDLARQAEKLSVGAAG